MSERAPDGAYVYQPHPMTRKDGRLWHVGGMPDGLTREQAQAIADILNGKADAALPPREETPNAEQQHWAKASVFIRGVLEALGFDQPPEEVYLDLDALLLQVIGQLEELKAEAEAQTLRAQIEPWQVAVRNLTPSDHPTDRRAVIVSRYWFEKLSSLLSQEAPPVGRR